MPAPDLLWSDDRITLTVDVTERRHWIEWGELSTEAVIGLMQRMRDEYEQALTSLRNQSDTQETQGDESTDTLQPH